MLFIMKIEINGDKVERFFATLDVLFLMIKNLSHWVLLKFKTELWFNTSEEFQAQR